MNTRKTAYCPNNFVYRYLCCSQIKEYLRKFAKLPVVILLVQIYRQVYANVLPITSVHYGRVEKLLYDIRHILLFFYSEESSTAHTIRKQYVLLELFLEKVTSQRVSIKWQIRLMFFLWGYLKTKTVSLKSIKVDLRRNIEENIRLNSQQFIRKVFSNIY